MNSFKSGSTLLFALLAIPAFAANTGIVIRTDQIRIEPFRDAIKIATLSIGDRVDIIKKNGGWLQIKSAKGKGWVHMLTIRKKEASKNSNNVGGLLDIASGRAGTGSIVATTGVRGLSAIELQEATYNEAELNQLESYTINSAEARRFALQGKLVARKFDYLPSPE